MSNVIVIGAGAAGLMTARTLSGKGVQVTVVEARDRPGGRIFTLDANEFSCPVDLGAEFVHGKPPILKSLIKEAGLKMDEGEGRLWHVAKNNVTEDDPFDEDWGEFMRKLNRLETDMPIGEFLRRYFSEESHASLRASVCRFVQGFDAADPDKVSALSLREEWSDPDDALMGSHIEGGLGSVVHYLERECLRNKVQFVYSTPVESIEWKRNSVLVRTPDREFQASLCVVTAPPAVLKKEAIRFTPDIIEHKNAINKIETGGVIKFLFEFHEAFWSSKAEKNLRQFPDMHFIFSDAYVPTWWSQLPSQQPLLTGWLSGPIVKTIARSPHELVNDGLDSLAYIFNTTVEEISARVRSVRVVNWETDPFSFGAYAYRSVALQSALEFLSQGVEHTIFFAGEAYSAGKEIGTVEAALDSGKKAAEKILKIAF